MGSGRLWSARISWTLDWFIQFNKGKIQKEGGTSICILGIYAARERPPFSALYFRSVAYHFHKWQKILLQSITILHFFPLRRPSFLKLLYVKAFHRRPRRAYCRWPLRKAFGQCSGVSGQPDCQPDASYSQFRRPHFHARACSRDPHFHTWAHSGAPHFSLCRRTYLPKFGVSSPPPPHIWNGVSITQKEISWKEIYHNFLKLKKATVCVLDAHESSQFAQHKCPV